MSISEIPFSSKISGVNQRIDRDFPSSARMGLLHLLHNLVRRRYVEGWVTLAQELQRIARARPTDYGSYDLVVGMRQAQKDSEAAINQLPWEKSYDFCERLHNHLAQEVGHYDFNSYEVDMTRGDVQGFIASELQRLFLEEGLAFEFRDGAVQRRGRQHTVERVTRAQVVLGDPRLAGARKHYNKALEFFRDPAEPDYENAVKEAVCSVEAAGKALFPEAKAATLGDLVLSDIN